MSRTLESPKSQAKAKTSAAPRPKETSRDLVEQIVVAFILAFLIRGFAVEAFVIPTGSMAPTLKGQHKEVTCPQCGWLYAVNAASETSEDGHMPEFVGAATCTNCRFRVSNLEETPTFKGDRILVMKFLYNLPAWLGGVDPRRWDVVVFHYPEEPEVNFIKRLVGLPNEVVKIYFGDVLTRPQNSEEPFRIQRKPLAQQMAVQQLVWDDLLRPRSFKELPRWQRWVSDAQKGQIPGTWKEETLGSYRIQAGTEWSSLLYQNLIPTNDQWMAAVAGEPTPGEIRPSLISDFYGYNSGNGVSPRVTESWFQPHWVGDLTISGQFTAKVGSTGHLRIELVEGGIPHRCEIDLATGLATLSRDGKTLGLPVSTSIKADDSVHDFAFANVDDRLTLWIDGSLPFGEGVDYETAETHPAPTAEDLRPVKISVQDADATVSGLVLKRDLYYTQDPSKSDYSEIDLRWPGGDDRSSHAVNHALDVLSDPAIFPNLALIKGREYPIAPGRYMMMGDNSPMSKDGRAWTRHDSNGYYDAKRRTRVESWSKNEDREFWEVPQEYLIGKAFFVFWPHGVPLWPNFGVPLPPKFTPSRDLRFPFRPYFERMKWIY